MSESTASEADQLAFPSIITLEPPYYACVFSRITRPDPDGLAAMNARMVELASQMPGFLGAEDVNEGSRGLGVSYWTDLDSVAAWKQNGEHRIAQALGKKRWFERFQIRIAKVERAYGFVAPDIAEGEHGGASEALGARTGVAKAEADK